MSNVIQFRPRPVGLLWSPRKGINPAWRLRAESRVLHFRGTTAIAEIGAEAAAYRAESARIDRMQRALSDIDRLITGMVKP